MIDLGIQWLLLYCPELHSSPLVPVGSVQVTDCPLRPKLRELGILMLMFCSLVVLLAMTQWQEVVVVVERPEACSRCMKMLFKLHRLCKTPL